LKQRKRNSGLADISKGIGLSNVVVAAAFFFPFKKTLEANSLKKKSAKNYYLISTGKPASELIFFPGNHFQE